MSHLLVSKRMVRSAAKQYLANLVQQSDPMTEPWKHAGVGDPVLVRDTCLEPSYWIAPVKRGRSVLGYVEVSMNYGVIGHAYFYENPENLNDCPLIVTRISREEALHQAKTMLDRYADAQFSKPLFVQDSARGRLAWMIQVRRNNELISRVFVTPGYVYERQVGVGREPGLRGCI